MTRITMTLEGLYPEYSDALRHSSEDTDELKEVLSKLGFARGELKTLSFSVDAEYEGYQEKNVYKQRFAGYRFRHMLKVEFDSDNDRLGKALYALANCAVSPELRISYTVKDQEAAKNALLCKAVTDAREKAAVLTQASGTVLKDIQTIDYSFGEISFEVQPMARNMMMKEAKAAAFDSAGYDMNINPDDIEISDSVTVIWEIG